MIEFCYVISMNALRIVALKLTNNFTAYLSVSIALRLIENLVISFMANKLYPYIKEKPDGKLDDETLSDIKKKVKALMFHKVRKFCGNRNR